MSRKAAQSPLFIFPDAEDATPPRSLRLVTPPAKPKTMPAPLTIAPAAPPACPDTDCHCCSGSDWWLLDEVVWRCGRCHPPLAGKVVRWERTRYKEAWEMAQPQPKAPVPVAIAAPVAQVGRIYVDEIVCWPMKPAPGAERFFGNGKPSCHMSTDDYSPAGLESLHRFAEGIGMRRSWFQDDEIMPHYDLTPSKRILAVKRGAVAVKGTEIVALCGKGRIRELLGEDAA